MSRQVYPAQGMPQVWSPVMEPLVLEPGEEGADEIVHYVDRLIFSSGYSSVGEFCKATGVSRVLMSGLYRRVTFHPTLPTLMKIHDGLGLDALLAARRR